MTRRLFSCPAEEASVRRKARIAELLHDQERISRELAALLEEEIAEFGPIVKARPPRTKPQLVRPSGTAQSHIAAKADRILRQRGFR